MNITSEVIDYVSNFIAPIEHLDPDTQVYARGRDYSVFHKGKIVATFYSITWLNDYILTNHIISIKEETER